MIKYRLKCSHGHEFESWFASASAFDALADAKRLTCAVCGTAEVEKALMAPRVTPGRKRAKGPAEAPEKAPAAPLSEPASDMEVALSKFRERVEAETEDVGGRFADEARAIHEGRSPDRAIRGQANLKEAKGLIEDGVPVLPLPFPSTRQVN